MSTSFSRRVRQVGHGSVVLDGGRTSVGVVPMTGVLRPCLDCGELSTDSRCDECRRERDRTQAREEYKIKGRRERLAGHESAAWVRLSKRARALQPWCSDCLRGLDQLESHERLEADHLPIAWAKYEKKKPILLTDVEVLCSTCNNAKGSSRPGSERFTKWLQENPTERESHDDKRNY